jgi:RimJ/RimL family protein N-acetyltransferase
MSHSTALQTAQTLLGSRSSTWEHLVERIVELLATDPERLLSILYRVDVSEERVREIFHTAPPHCIAPELAVALVDRLAQKRSLRAWYMEQHAVTQVQLRPYTSSDALDLFNAVIESFDDLHRWLNWCHAEYSIDDAQSWCTYAAEEYRRRTSFHFVVEARIGEQWHFAGGCGLVPTSDRSSAVAMLGYWTRSSLAGCGIAPRAARQAVEFAFDQGGIARIEIYIATPNKASQRVAEKLGARREALLRSRIAVGDKRFDAFLYSILCNEWHHPEELSDRIG